jgi:hypothetical protein
MAPLRLLLSKLSRRTTRPIWRKSKRIRDSGYSSVTLQLAGDAALAMQIQGEQNLLFVGPRLTKNPGSWRNGSNDPP